MICLFLLTTVLFFSPKWSPPEGRTLALYTSSTRKECRKLNVSCRRQTFRTGKTGSTKSWTGLFYSSWCGKQLNRTASQLCLLICKSHCTRIRKHILLFKEQYILKALKDILSDSVSSLFWLSSGSLVELILTHGKQFTDPGSLLLVWWQKHQCFKARVTTSSSSSSSAQPGSSWPIILPS